MSEIEYLREAAKLIQEKRMDEAKVLLDKAKSINPQNDALWFLYSFAVSNRKQAISCVKKTLDINPLNYMAWNHLDKLEKEAAQSEQMEIKEVSLAMKKNGKKILSTILSFVSLLLGLLLLFSSFYSTENTNTNFEYGRGTTNSTSFHFSSTQAAIGAFLIFLFIFLSVKRKGDKK